METERYRARLPEQKHIKGFVFSVAILLILVACSAPVAAPVQENPIYSPVETLTPDHGPEPSSAGGLSDDQIATLNSLEKVDEHPLYTMSYIGWYAPPETVQLQREIADRPPGPSAWACSLFAALNDPQNKLFGRNFDWQHSPALLLFTDPPVGYASVSLVDIAYLGFQGAAADNLLELSISDRQSLLDAPQLPFDGMNEHGLVVGMAAVPPGNVEPDPGKPTVGSLGIIRLMLDQTANVSEAIALMQQYNIDFEGGPPIHYLIADAAGATALVEYYRGEMIISYSQNPWDQATNFLRAENAAEGQCWRYDRIRQEMDKVSGKLEPSSAIELLGEVAQNNTQWSVVYMLDRREIHLAMGRAFDRIHTFVWPTP